MCEITDLPLKRYYACRDCMSFSYPTRSFRLVVDLLGLSSHGQCAWSIFLLLASHSSGWLRVRGPRAPSAAPPLKWLPEASPVALPAFGVPPSAFGAPRVALDLLQGSSRVPWAPSALHPRPSRPLVWPSGSSRVPRAPLGFLAGPLGAPSEGTLRCLLGRRAGGLPLRHCAC